MNYSKYNELKEWILKNCSKTINFNEEEVYIYNNTYSFSFQERYCLELESFSYNCINIYNNYEPELKDCCSFVCRIAEVENKSYCWPDTVEESKILMQYIELNDELENKPEEKRKVIKL